MRESQAASAAAPQSAPAPQDADLSTDGDAGIAEELLVEEVSIDGMCGVY